MIIYNILQLQADRAEFIFKNDETNQPLLKDENDNEIVLDKKLEIFLLAVIFWVRKLTKHQMHVFQDELQIIIESVVFMAIYDKKQIEIKTNDKRKPVISKDNESAMFIMHSIAEIRRVDRA